MVYKLTIHFSKSFNIIKCHKVPDTQDYSEKINFKQNFSTKIDVPNKNDSFLLCGKTILWTFYIKTMKFHINY